MSCARRSSDSVASFTSGGTGLYWKLALVSVISVFCLSLFVSGGNVIVRNGQLNVSAGIYGDSDTFYVDSENDRVGIGTISPTRELSFGATDAGIFMDTEDGSDSKRLQIGGGGNAVYTRGAYINLFGEEYAGESGNLKLITGETGNLSIYGSSGEDVRITNDGYVGIGTTIPRGLLEVYDDSNEYLFIDGNDSSDFLTIVKSDNDNYAVNITNGGGDGLGLYVRAANGGDGSGIIAQFSDYTASRLIIKEGGYVGIGTISPTRELSFGATNAGIFMDTEDGSDSKRLQIGGGGNAVYTRGAYINLYGEDYPGNAGNLQLITGETGNLSIYGSSGEDVRITNDGYVGIGAVEPSGMLTVTKGHDSGTTQEMFRTNFDGNWGLRLVQNYVGSGDIKYELKQTYASAEYDVLAFKAGNVGIGTTSPTRPLHVSSALDVVAKFASTDAVTGIELNDTGGTVYIYGRSGNVGIDSSDPTEKLDVNGAIQLGTTASSCDSSHRGVMKFVTGNPDILYVCMKDSSTGYNWVIVARGD